MGRANRTAELIRNEMIDQSRRSDAAAFSFRAPR
jgi:hypothetical protein